MNRGQELSMVRGRMGGLVLSAAFLSLHELYGGIASIWCEPMWNAPKHAKHNT